MFVHGVSGRTLRGSASDGMPTAMYCCCCCCNVWRVLQNERVLFHYNGHGVPRPTVNGEIWVFNSRCVWAWGRRRGGQANRDRSTVQSGCGPQFVSAVLTAVAGYGGRGRGRVVILGDIVTGLAATCAPHTNSACCTACSCRPATGSTPMVRV
jgi:hypothetical protein